MTEPQEQPEEKKVFLRSQNQWKVGEKWPIAYVPTVEGMVASTRWVENSLMIIFLSPAHTKAEGTWADAALTYKTAASLVRKALPSYEYPFPTDTRILEEVKKANGNLEMLHEIVKYLNRYASSSFSDQQKAKLVNKPVVEPEELAVNPAERDNSDRLSLQLFLSQPDQPDANTQDIQDKVITKLADAVARRLSLDSEEKKQQTKKKKKKSIKKTRHTSSSSSSEPSDSEHSATSTTSSEENNVRESDQEDGKGWFECPFSVKDVRTTAEPRKKMEGKVEERRYLRKALHNIYSEYNTLKTFVDTVRAESSSSATKPYNSDLIWLSFHATYIDALLIHASDGSWTTWNQLAIDHLMKSFLELLVRSSVNRAYPDILDERVCKWMKRKRVGLSTQFGAIPNYLIGAKITDSGIHPKGGWEGKNINKNFSSSSSSNFSKTKPQNSQNGPKT